MMVNTTVSAVLAEKDYIFNLIVSKDLVSSHGSYCHPVYRRYGEMLQMGMNIILGDLLITKINSF